MFLTASTSINSSYRSKHTLGASISYFKDAIDDNRRTASSCHLELLDGIFTNFNDIYRHRRRGQSLNTTQKFCALKGVSSSSSVFFRRGEAVSRCLSWVHPAKAARPTCRRLGIFAVWRLEQRRKVYEGRCFSRPRSIVSRDRQSTKTASPMASRQGSVTCSSLAQPLNAPSPRLAHFGSLAEVSAVQNAKTRRSTATVSSRVMVWSCFERTLILSARGHHALRAETLALCACA